MKRLIILFVSILFISGCQSQANFVNVVNSWKGQPIEAMINDWGYPDSTMKAPNGNEVYIYHHSSSFAVPQTSTATTSANVYGNTLYGTTNTSTSGGYTVDLNCSIFVEISESKVIERITWKGNNCVA